MAKKRSKMVKPKIKKPKTTKAKKGSKKKPAKKKKTLVQYEEKILFEDKNGKFYSDSDCEHEAESLEQHLLDGWKEDKCFEGDASPKLRRQYILKRPDKSGEEPLGIHMF